MGVASGKSYCQWAISAISPEDHMRAVWAARRSPEAYFPWLSDALLGLATRRSPQMQRVSLVGTPTPTLGSKWKHCQGPPRPTK